MYRSTPIRLFAIAAVASLCACGGCDQTIDDKTVPHTDGGSDGSTANAGSGDAGGDDASMNSATSDGGDAGETGGDSGTDGGADDAGTDDLGGGSDAGDPDGGSGDGGSGMDTNVQPVCGDGATEGVEACDDGNTDDGDYCSGDCGQVTGSCGDGTVQANENCDDGVTADCSGTHDGGDGTCVPAGSCSSGYMLDGTGTCVPTNTTGLPTPCSNGSGQTLFRFHYDNGSTSARVDVWDASCSYSFAPNSACNVREVYPGFGEVDRTSDGYPVLSSTEYIRVRFSVAGINFNQATLYVRARSYATASSTDIEAWSPLYGSAYFGPVDNDFVYDWYSVDWSAYLTPFDDPDLTAIQLYAYQGSNSLAVRAVELCLE